MGVLLLAGCGTGGGSTAGGGSAPSGRVGTMPFAITSTGTVKVVVNATTSVPTPVQVYDAVNDAVHAVACTATGTECSAFAGASCSSTLSVCAYFNDANTILYAKNQTLTHLKDPAVIPCDGRTYTVEVYGSNSTASPYDIGEMHVSQPFVMQSDCTASPATPVWDSPAPAYPALTVDKIYFGLPAPYDTYQVKASIAYPFATSGWTIIQGTDPAATTAVKPVSYGSASATFTSPLTVPAGCPGTAAGACDLPFRGTFNLKTSLLVGSSDVWQRTVSGTGTVEPAGSIALP